VGQPCATGGQFLAGLQLLAAKRDRVLTPTPQGSERPDEAVHKEIALDCGGVTAGILSSFLSNYGLFLRCPASEIEGTYRDGL
jgi:hypothetical protein